MSLGQVESRKGQSSLAGGTVNGGRSRVTGAIRLLLSLWLIVSAVGVLSNPHEPITSQGYDAIPLSTALPLAATWFTLGVFLLTGFMSRVCGLILVGVGVWAVASFGASALPVVSAIVGVYLMLRGGGAWAMDIYVQKMQDRARRKAAISSPESS